ncbi:hypothetical protein D6D06_04888, partial [Aureobasidium pullulans]
GHDTCPFLQRKFFHKSHQLKSYHLYEPSYVHVDREKSCKKCGCEAGKRVDRSTDDSDDENIYEEDDNWLTVHRGTIASGELVMRDGRQRDTLAQSDKILCFEMEAAGALNNFPCLVVRGISDYSDSHKNDKWHGYAAAVAAAYARELFYHMPVDEVKQCRISETATDVKEMIQNTRKSARAADYTEDLRIKQWLGPADTYINYTSAFALHHENTGRWFLEGSRYESFRDTPDARLWLRGIPGCGKTVLASTVIHDLQRRVGSAASTVIFFFFSFSNESKQKLDHMLRSLIFQLSERHQTAKDRLVVEFKEHNDGRKPLHGTALQSVFGQMVDTVQNVTIVLDALDESTTRPELLKWITSFPSGHGRFLLTSRSEMEIEDFLTSWLPSNCAITLENEPVDDDIKAYVHHRLEIERNLSRWRSMHNKISDTLVEKASGMFQWVYCQLQELSGCLDKAAVRLMLQTLPLDLNHTYDRILDNIPRSRVPNAIKLLQFLAFSNRPLSLRELVDVVATDPNTSIPFDIEGRAAPPDTIIGYCSSLVRLTGQTVDYKQAGSASATALPYASGIGPPPAPDAGSELHLEAGSDVESETEYGDEPQLELAHFSVKEYLLLHRKETPYQEYFQIPAANAKIASTCLAYLWTLQEPHLTKLMDTTHRMETHKIRTKFPLTDFATRHWLDHARLAGDNQERLFFWTSKIFVDKPFMEFWLQFYNPALGWGQELLYVKVTAPALYYASLGDLDRSIRLLLDRGAYIDAGSETGRSALQIAAHEGNAELVEILIRWGANVNAQNRRFYEYNSASHLTALTAASSNGHVRTVQILLEHGSDINAGLSTTEPFEGEFSFSGPALRAASANGHFGVVQLLLDHGADVNFDGHGFALHAALSRSHTEVSLLLLGRGANICARDKAGTALCAAVNGGDLTIVKLLLEKGAHNTEWGLVGAVEGAVWYDRFDMLEALLLHYAERDRENYVLRNAFGITVSNTDGRIIRKLLEMGADNTHHKNNLLAEACHRGYVATVELLLDFDAELDRYFHRLIATDDSQWMHDLVASEGDQFEIVKLLVARGAKLNQNDLYNATALKYACAVGHYEVIKYLLDNGADVNKSCDYLNLPLESACRSGSLEVINMLLKYGARVNERHPNGQDALEVACGHQNIEVVRLLIDHDADVKACDSGALVAASRRGHIGIAQFLLAQGADVNGRRKSETPIQAACSEGHFELVKLLLVNGADHNAARRNSGSALSNACLSGNTALVSLLLGRGVHPNARDKSYGSALQGLCAYSLDIDPEMIQLLLDRGADVDARGGKFGTALCEAASQNKVKMVRMLLERGADPNLRDKRFGSALQAACGGRYGTLPDLVQLVLNNGADVNARGGKYGNALCAAVRTQSTEVVQMLLAEGAYINSWGGRRGDALRIALRISLQDERKDMVRILIKWGWIFMIRIRPVWKRRCNMSRSQPRTRFQKRDYWRSNNPSWDSWRRVTTNGTSSGSVSSGGSCSIKSWISTGSCDVSNSESGSD